MINIQSFAKAKEGTSYITKSSSGFSNNKSTTVSLDTHNIWGQPFNGTEDVTGNLTNVGSIDATDNILTEGKLIIRLLDDENQVVNDGDFTMSVEDNTAYFSGKDLYLFYGDIYGDSITSDGDLSVTGSSSFNDNAVFHTNIEVKGLSTLNEVTSNNIVNSDTIKTKNLEVTGLAHFFELITDKIKAAGGAVIFTPANGFKVDIIENVTDGFKLYWLADDGEGNLADNMWKVNDLALCMSFNQAKEGISHNVSNKYYWSLVTDVSDTNQPVDIEGKKYHFITISTVTKDGTVNPEVGDNITMLGYRGNDDKKRQSAIYISAYSSLDKGLSAPLLAQYLGINDFDLESHRKSYFDAENAKFVGTFEVSNGLTIEDYINNKIDGAESGTPYIGDNGNWFVWDSEAKVYKDSGIKAEGKDGVGIDGSNGKDAEFDKLFPLIEKAVVDKNGTLGISLRYYIRHIKGNDSTLVSTSTSGYYVRFRPNTSSDYILLTVNTVAPTYLNTAYQTDYHKQTHKIEYLIVLLVSSNIVKDQRIIPVQFAASATLEITDNIKTTVQNNTSSISDLAGKVETNTNNISTVTLKANSIESTVENNTTSINTLNGLVELNTLNISKITLKADSIESTVSTINLVIGQTSQERRNLITGSYLKRVSKFYGGKYLTALIVKGKKYTFSFNGYCTLALLDDGLRLLGFAYDSTWKIQNESLSITSTTPVTVSKTFTAKYTGEMRFDFYPYKEGITADEANAITDFIVVNWCQLEEGEVVTPWTLAEGEPEIRENLITTDIKDLMATGNGTTVVASVIENGCTLKDGTSYDCIHVKYTGTGEGFDAVRLLNPISLEDHQTYTLSFYAKGIGLITSYLYPLAVMGWIDGNGTLIVESTSHTSSTDGNSTIQLTDEWKRYVVIWTAYCNDGWSKNLLIGRFRNGADGYIAAVKFEKGGYATAYLKYPDKSISKIIQTAGNIKAEVYDELNKSTGIDIKSGSITLNADKTTIKGNLNITDTLNGLTVYENTNNVLIPRINLQPKLIEDITALDNDSISTVTFHIDNKIMADDGWSVELGYKDIECNKADVITNGFVILREYRFNSDNKLISPIKNGTYTLIVKLLKIVNNIATDVETLTIDLNYTVDFNANNSIKFTIPEKGTYRLVFTSDFTVKISADETDYNKLLAHLDILINKANKVMTYIGTDGMYCHSGANKCFYVNNKETIIQHDICNGIKWDNTNAIRKGNQGMKVIALIDGSTPIWYPFYNYTPVTTFNIGGTFLSYIQNIQKSAVYRVINPLKDCGICYVENPAMDLEGNIVDSYVLLPPSDFYIYGGHLFNKDLSSKTNKFIHYTLPVGYTVLIINGGYGNNKFNLFVSAYVTKQHKAVFIDGHRDKNWEVNLNGSVHWERFIYMGSYYSTDCNDMQDIWMVLGDAQ